MENKHNAKQLELAYQASQAAEIGEIAPTPERIIERYRRCRWWWVYPKELMFKYLNAIGVEQKEILDIGCGSGEISAHLAKLGANVTAIDISPELVEIATRRASLDGVRGRVQFIVGDLEEGQLPRNKFDCVVCFAVLHHVDVRLVVPLIFSWLKPGGTVVMVEAIAFSPLLQKIRDLIPIPKEGGPIDRQLNKQTVNFLLRTFADSQATYFYFIGRLQRLFPHWVLGCVMLGTLDRFLLALFPFLSKFCGEAVLIGHKPHCE